MDGMSDIPASPATPTSDWERERAHLYLAVTEIGECLSGLGRLLRQGVRPDTEALHGHIAFGLRKAAHRIEHGNMDTFLTGVPESGARS